VQTSFTQVGSAMRLIAAMAMIVGVAASARAQEKEPEPVDPKVQQAKEAFDRIYGAKLAEVKGTSTKFDDVRFAEQMRDDLDALKGNPELLKLVLEEIVTLASSAAPGIPLAIEVIDRQMRRDPSMYAFGLQERMRLREIELRFAHGSEKREVAFRLMTDMSMLATEHVRNEAYDEALELYRKALMLARRFRMKNTTPLEEMIAALQERNGGEAGDIDPTLSRRIDLLKQRLNHNQKDRNAANELIEIYLVKLDQPEEAKKWTLVVEDESLKEKIRLAARPVDELAFAECERMGAWYRELAPTTRSHERRNMLARSHRYYQAAIQKTDDAIERTRLRVIAGRVMDAINELN